MASISSHHPSPVYLLDFSVYKPPEELRVDRVVAEKKAEGWSMYSPEMKEFLVKVLGLSGLSQNGTFLPPAIHPAIAPEPVTDVATALLEAKAVMTGAVGELLVKTGLRPSDIDILVTNCSIFCPTPDMASMLVNHFKFRSDTQTYHLGGMGCGNGVVAINLVRDLLQARPNAVALFVPAEITTAAFYAGKHKQYMVANAIFRMGGAAALLSNKEQYRRTAKYQLVHTVRVHTGQSDESYGCMSWGPDPDGVNGVYLGKNVSAEAATALKTALTTITPKILTWAQYAEAAYHLVASKLGAAGGGYLPDFARSTIDHFAIHAGGYAVLKAVQAGMSLPASKLLPSFAALREYGNTSCSTTWYVMAYMESIGAIKRGQQVMQIGMGGGMMVGINVWRALHSNASVHPAWVHLASSPLTEADLPRAIEAPKTTAAAAVPVAAATAADKDPNSSAVSGEGVGVGMARGDGAHLTGKAAVPRRPTVEVKAFDEDDEDLAMRMH